MELRWSSIIKWLDSVVHILVTPQNVIVADDIPSVGKKAVQQLCDMHGKDRARFALCALNSICKFEGNLLAN